MVLKVGNLEAASWVILAQSFLETASQDLGWKGSHHKGLENSLPSSLM